MEPIPQRYKRKGREAVFLLAKGFSLSIAAVVLQYSPSFFSEIASKRILLTERSHGSFEGQISTEPGETYFLSLGRPRGSCELSIDGSLADSNRSAIEGIRSKLMMGAGFRAKSASTMIEVDCQREAGFGFGFTHLPVFATYRTGVMLHQWRAFTDLFLGPLAGLLLLVTILFSASGKTGLIRNRNRSLYLTYAFVSFFYLLSLSHVPRLFFDSFIATAVHVHLRVAFSLAFYLLCTSINPRRVLIVALHFIIFFSLAIISITAPETLSPTYSEVLPFFALVTAICFWDAIHSNDQQAHYLAFISGAWFIAQVSDLIVDATNIGPYSAPATIAVVAIVSAGFYRRRLAQLQMIEGTVVEILRAVSAAMPISAKLANVAGLLGSLTHFDRVTAYVDTFVLGGSERPKAAFTRVFESGYQASNDKFRNIEFAQSAGNRMEEAINNGKPILSQGEKDNSWFAVIPIGASACINLSDSVSHDSISAHESFSILERILPSLAPLGDQLVTHGTRSGLALETLRLKKGLGIFSTELGATFVDINYYADNRRRFKDPYAVFIASVYFPALSKKVRPWAVRETTRGDELYLATVPDLIEDNCDLANALYNVVRNIFDFAENEGARLCRTYGYEPVTLQLGACLGQGRIISDPEFVRTEGDAILQAARLQKAASIGGALVDNMLAAKWSTNGDLVCLPHSSDIAKRTQLQASKVLFRGGAKRAA